MHGLLLIDKPAGMTSHDVVRQVRRLCRTKKVGHAGTLDPLATGVLPVAIGDGTKILQFLLAENKTYRATVQLGVTTDTLDAEGQILLQRAIPDNAFERLESVCAKFRGDIEQIPPMYSALKKNGIPLYKLARSGQTVEREPRPVRIERLDVVATDSQTLTIEVACSKGTYIRTLAADIGEELGCGAHLTALRRLSCGQFSLENCIALDELTPESAGTTSLLSLDQALSDYPAITLGSEASRALSFGVPPELAQVICNCELQEGTLVRLQVEGRLSAMARYAPSRKQERRGDFELIRVLVGR